MKPVIAIVGATGAVGSEFLLVLKKMGFKFEQLHLVASKRSAGRVLKTVFGDHEVVNIEQFDFSQVKYAFFSAGGNVSREWAPKVAAQGAIVIDNTSAFRMQDTVPLIVPEINQSAYTGQKLISNPNCSTIQLVRALAPIHERFGVRKVIASTYQAVSGAGNEGVNGLHASLIDSEGTGNSSPFSRPIAHNVIPQIDRFMDNGFTFEEEKVRFETRKILNEPDMFVTCTAVRVPVFRGHSVAAYIETDKAFDMGTVKAALVGKGIKVAHNPEDFPTPRTIEDKEDVYVGRIRREPGARNGLWLWVVADNLWVGAAWNAVRIAQELER
ncbi:aspartate-semialdehyde dehydrogenase [Marinobacter xestospongiae]|uniref:aspartate-semialdehyde dehydrogenase n=1 Tax=Marinobacter xestospongiae TaxID=994319 RepID=UPI0020060041|nr:aspartate-semialdehyde dehydrogenase [Marinobacter xestospongiae]MCK7565052.1 aspartate-semialdehyde dehydrogenase [Marinobacter xestospongiae]